jgi:hypothetical protein
MNLGRLRSRTAREWVSLLLLPALALRLLVPEGFMPASGEAGALTMQMCHGDARSAIVMRLVGDDGAARGDHGDSSGGEARHDSPCVFAASASTAPPGVPATPSSIDPVASVATPALRATAPPTRPSHRCQAPRAPPTLV